MVAHVMSGLDKVVEKKYATQRERGCHRKKSGPQDFA